MVRFKQNRRTISNKIGKRDVYWVIILMVIIILLNSFNIIACHERDTEINDVMVNNEIYYAPTSENFQLSDYAIWKPANDIIKDFTVAENYVFVLTANGFLFIIDNQNLEQFKVVSKLYINRLACDMDYSNQKLFFACQTFGLKIIDISNIFNPKVEFVYQKPNTSFEKVFVSNDTIFLITSEKSISILANNYDLITETTPGIMTKIHDVSIKESYLFLAVEGSTKETETTKTKGMAIIDIKNIRFPKMLSFYFEQNYDNQNHMGIFPVDGYTYLVDGYEGLKIFDVKDIANPTKISEYSENELYYDVSSADHYLFITTQEQGLQIFDTSEIHQPRKIAQFFIRSATNKLYIDEERTLISNKENGLISIDFDCDNDNLNDLDELSKFNSNPTMKDTDSDKLTDFQEVIIYETDPTSKDTDGDSFSDYYEIQRNHNPLDENDHPLYFSVIALLVLIAISMAIFLMLRVESSIVKYKQYREKQLRHQKAFMKNTEIRLFKLIHLIDAKKYSFRQFGRILRVNNVQIYHIFRLWCRKNSIAKLGYINLKKRVFIKEKESHDYSANRYCYYCNNKMRKNDLICKRCHNEVDTCYTCNNTINYNDPVGVCPICLNKFHLDHLLKHVDQEEYCPQCQYEVTLKEVGAIIPYHRQKRKSKK